MPVQLRITANCLMSAILAVASFWAMVSVAFYMNRNGEFVHGFLANTLNYENVALAAFIYDIFRFLVFGSVAAALMVLLKPRHVLLYSIASALPIFFVFTGISFNKSFKADAVNGAD